MRYMKEPSQDIINVINTSFENKLNLSNKSYEEEQTLINKGKNPPKYWDKIYRRIGKKTNRQDIVKYTRAFRERNNIKWEHLSQREIDGHLRFNEKSSKWTIMSRDWVGFWGEENNPFNFEISDVNFEKVIIKWFRKVKKEFKRKGYKVVFTDDKNVLYECNYLQTPIITIVGLKITNE